MSGFDGYKKDLILNQTIEDILKRLAHLEAQMQARNVSGRMMLSEIDNLKDRFDAFVRMRNFRDNEFEKGIK